MKNHLVIHKKVTHLKYIFHNKCMNFTACVRSYRAPHSGKFLSETASPQQKWALMPPRQLPSQQPARTQNVTKPHSFDK